MRILIVDDSNVIIARLMNLLLEYEEIVVVGLARDYAEAVRVISDVETDIIILDVKLPGGNGIDLINFIKYKQPDSVIIMLTNYPYPQIKARCRELGAKYFFDKSKDIDKLVQTIIDSDNIQTGVNVK